jgi:hypothetical protein
MALGETRVGTRRGSQWASLVAAAVCLYACTKEAQNVKPPSAQPPSDRDATTAATATATSPGDATPVTGNAAVPRGFRPVSGPGYRGYLRTDLPGDAWGPSEGVLAELERKLLPAFEEAMKTGKLPDASPDLLKRLPSYVRVYHPYKVGVIDVALYCDKAEKDALDPAGGPGSIKGGGDCYAHARYVDDKGGYFTIVRTNARR